MSSVMIADTSIKSFTVEICRLIIAATSGVQSTFALSTGLTDLKRTLAMQLTSTPFWKKIVHQYTERVSS
jgi:hypothetical protein